MREVALVDILLAEFHLADLVPGLAAEQRGDLKILPLDARDIVIAQVHRLPRIRHHRADIAGQKVLPLADPQHQRAAAPSPHHDIRQVTVDQRDPIGPDDLFKRRAHRVDQPRLRGFALRRVVMLADEMGEHFSIGLRLKGVPLADQVVAQGLVILDDAIVDERELVALVKVRVGILIRHAAMGGPAGVADAHGALRRLGQQEIGQVGNAAHALAHLHRPTLDGGDTRRVVAAVFEPPQPIQEDGSRLGLSDISNDSAHKGRKVTESAGARKGWGFRVDFPHFRAKMPKSSRNLRGPFPTWRSPHLVMTSGKIRSIEQSTLAIIMGGGAGTRLFPLTKDRSKPAVPLAGKYRIVDIPISNCINSGLRQMYVLTQFNSTSLIRHISSAYKFDQFSRSFVEVLAAQQTPSGAHWYQGTADAVRRNLRDFLQRPYDYFIILSGDQLYKMDYRDVIKQHIEKKSDITIATIPVARSAASDFGIMHTNAERRIIRFEEKPKEEALLDELKIPPALLGELGVAEDEDLYQASMGIYVFNRATLESALDNDCVDFGKHIIPHSIKELAVHAYIFQGYWEAIRN